MPSDWVGKELKLWGSIQGELEVFALVEDHHLVQFSMEECRRVLQGGPWFVASQLPVVEPWVPDFIPISKVVRKNDRLGLSSWVAYGVLRAGVASGHSIEGRHPSSDG